MSIIKEKSNSSNTIRYYESAEVKTDLEALRWLSLVRMNNGVSVDYINFSDLLNRSDEGSDSIQLDSDITDLAMEEIYRSHEISLISISGTFYEKPVTIGVDMRNHSIFITIRNKKPADISSLEHLLHLV